MSLNMTSIITLPHIFQPVGTFRSYIHYTYKKNNIILIFLGSCVINTSNILSPLYLIIKSNFTLSPHYEHYYFLMIFNLFYIKKN